MKLAILQLLQAQLNKWQHGCNRLTSNAKGSVLEVFNRLSVEYMVDIKSKIDNVELDF
jgi:hypothetical protein